jgi:hypothetical protein
VVRAHKCIRETNKELAKHNTKLVGNLLNPNHIFIDTQRVKPLRGKKAKVVIATYCPFCGEKLVDA